MKRLKHTLCILLTVVLTLTSLTLLPVSAEADGDTVITVPITVQEEYDMAQEFFEILNRNRADAGKYEYILDDRLMDVAMERAAQCCIYFGHGSMVYERKEHAALEGTAEGSGDGGDPDYPRYRPGGADGGPGAGDEERGTTGAGNHGRYFCSAEGELYEEAGALCGVGTRESSCGIIEAGAGKEAPGR